MVRGKISIMESDNLKVKLTEKSRRFRFIPTELPKGSIDHPLDSCLPQCGNWRRW